jgi:hypothetical protein
MSLYSIEEHVVLKSRLLQVPQTPPEAGHDAPYQIELLRLCEAGEESSNLVELDIRVVPPTPLVEFSLFVL